MREFLRGIIERQHRIVQFGGLAVAGLIGFAESRGDPFVAVLLYGLVPFLCLGLVLLWTQDVARLTFLHGAAPKGDPYSEDPLPYGLLDREVDAGRAASAAIAISAVGASLLSLALGLRELLGIEDRPGYGKAPVLAYCVYAVLALVVFVIVIGRQRVLRGQLVVASAAAAAATLCALGATLAVAVLYDGPSPSRAPSATRTPAPAPAPNDARTPYRYVALGDSYAAGEGVRPYESGTQDVEEGGNRCHRSEAAYARLLVLGKPLRLDFRACSGARIAHILDAAQRETPAAPIQVPGPLGDDVSLVTLSIGGNDLAFADLLVHCSFRWNCFTKDKPFRDGLPAAQWLDRELETIPNRLRAVYEGVRGAAPRARILVLGYPYLFPDGRLSLNVHCGLASGLWDAAERREIRALGLRLNEAAEGATAGLAEFVDVAAPFTGHEPCGRERDWVEAERIKARKIYEGSFHPNADGQAAFARLVACHLFLQPPVGVGPEPSPTSEPAETMDDCLAAG